MVMPEALSLNVETIFEDTATVDDRNHSYSYFIPLHTKRYYYLPHGWRDFFHQYLKFQGVALQIPFFQQNIGPFSTSTPHLSKSWDPLPKSWRGGRCRTCLSSQVGIAWRMEEILAESGFDPIGIIVLYIPVGAEFLPSTADPLIPK